MAKTEDIEAKLAAFVDGDIDPAGRAEIEKHLANNPKHRDLLADLSRQRDLLRALPRDLAPVDVAETINSQLERAVLLGDVDADTEIAGSIGRWSQLRAIAAVLLLTGGLAGVIYYLLPSPRHGTELADLRIPGSSTTYPAAVELALSAPSNPAKSASKVVADSDVATRLQSVPLAPASEPAVAEVQARPQIALADDQMPGGARGGFRPGGGGGSREGFEQMASNAMPRQTEIFKEVVQSRQSQASQKQQTQEQRAQSVYVVSTDNPESTGRDLKDYLRNNKITWDEAAAEAMPAPLDAAQQQNALSMRQQQMPTMQLKSAPDAAVAQQSELKDLVQSPKGSKELIVARQVTPEQAVALKGWLDRRQSPARQDELPRNPQSGQPLVPISGDGAIAPASPRPTEIAASPTTLPTPENSPTTLPFALDTSLNSVLDFSPLRLDAPGIELDAHRAEPLSTSNSRDQLAAAPTTQGAFQPLTLGVGPATLPDTTAGERVDVVIVLEAQAVANPLIPTTAPATTAPSSDPLQP